MTDHWRVGNRLTVRHSRHNSPRTQPSSQSAEVAVFPWAWTPSSTSTGRRADSG